MPIQHAMIATFGLLAILTSSWPGSGQEPSVPLPAGEHRLRFQQRDGLIYIKARVNGKGTTLLLDTGSTVTLLSRRLVSTLSGDSRVTINLAKGSVSAFNLSVGLILGDSDSRERQCSFRKNAFVGDFQFADAEGLLGNDVLSLFKSVTFDFKSSTLILEDR